MGNQQLCVLFYSVEKKKKKKLSSVYSQWLNQADVKMCGGGDNVVFNYNLNESQKKEDKKRGASRIPEWVENARLKNKRVRMQELEYWINYTDRVPYNRKLKPEEWAQVKIFELPKKTLKLQVAPEHWDVFSSMVKLIKPRKGRCKYVHLIVYSLSGGFPIINLHRLYGRFDDSNLSKDFELIETTECDSFNYAEYKFKNKYEVHVYQCYFNENQ